MKVEVYSDVVCPWCYIGERRFARALAAFPGAAAVDVEFRPYQLDPDAPAEAIPHAQYMRRRFGSIAPNVLQRVTDAAAAEGITMDWERALTANTRAAHRLLGLAAREYGAEVQRALAERLFALHFTEGGNLADAAQLADAAVAAGMERARVETYLAADEGAGELDEELGRARALGIQAVPTFVIDGKWVIQGAQAPSVFLAALEQVAADSDAAAEDVTCTDGACAIG